MHDWHSHCAGAIGSGPNSTLPSPIAVWAERRRGGFQAEGSPAVSPIAARLASKKT